MRNNNQSSVEWLQWALEHTVLTHEQIMQTIGLFEQAKAMHKEEIIKARQNGLDNGFSNGSWDSQLYYTEEFGGSND